jgi:hypothetical protein
MRGVYLCMAGRFEGLSDLEWKLFEDIFPNEPLLQSTSGLTKYY